MRTDEIKRIVKVGTSWRIPALGGEVRTVVLREWYSDEMGAVHFTQSDGSIFVLDVFRETRAVIEPVDETSVPYYDVMPDYSLSDPDAIMPLLTGCAWYWLNVRTGLFLFKRGNRYHNGDVLNNYRDHLAGEKQVYVYCDTERSGFQVMNRVDISDHDYALLVLAGRIREIYTICQCVRG